MYRIAKTFEFSASHVLNGLPDGHPCGRLHGHNYTVEVEVAATYLDLTMFVIDYGELAVVKNYLDHTFDHRHLNDVIDGNPTAEHLAHTIYGVVEETLWEPHPDRTRWHVTAVTVRETPKTWATYRP